MRERLDPSIHFPEDLPVTEHRDEIARALREHQVIVVAGETGSGKTTQLPKIALALGRTSIAHTQPRRIAARAVAERIAEELGVELGGRVGYQVRFTDRVSDETELKVMTDGVLLNELNRDRFLKRYDTIIIDEAHERSLNIDFLLGYLTRLLPKRPDLKLIITSATIDVERFSEHFGGAPIISVSGRTYPVEVRYRPLVIEQEDASGGRGGTEPGRPEQIDLFEGIRRALVELAHEPLGDVLVFLSGEAEIRDATDALASLTTRGPLDGTEVIPLFGRLSAAEQHRVFDRSRPAGIRRRVVLATNVAETSITVPGIRYVIDGGTARISRYSARSQVQRLPIEPISQASANQRAGRAGRLAPGVAIRLHSEEDFLGRPEFTQPEILRTNLASVILRMLSLRLGDVSDFPFLEPPDRRGVKDGHDLLTELGAVRDGKLTKIGRELARIPIDPRYGRMLLESRRNGVTHEVMAIVAGLSVQDVRERPLEQRGAADAAHARFTDPTSDFLTLLNLWNFLAEQRERMGSSAFRRLCRTSFLNYLRVREWQDVYRQLASLGKPLGLTTKPAGANPDGIHRSLLAGLLSHLGVRDRLDDAKAARRGDGKRRPAARYLGSRQAKFLIFPGSALAKHPPEALMSAELVETSQLFARTNAAIDPTWAEPLAGALAKHSFSDPSWDRERASAYVLERVTLYGVPIVDRRRAQLARFDQAQARWYFIQYALVQGEWDAHHEFDRRNRQLLRRLREVEERSRGRASVVSEESVFRFYDERIPEDVVSGSSFDRWWRQRRKDAPDLLDLRSEEIVDDPDELRAADESRYPRRWTVGEQRLQVRYRFEPGAEDDGVTIAVPLPVLPTLSEAEFTALVPGLREELATALIRSLPKALRRQVVPAADWAHKLTAALDAAPAREGETFPQRLAAQITQATGAPVRVEDFDLSKVPAHLTPNFAVVDRRGRRLAVGKHLDELRASFRDRAGAEVRARVEETAEHAIERDRVEPGQVGDLPRTVETRHGGSVVRGFPAYVEEGDRVALRVCADAPTQERAMPLAVARLLAETAPGAWASDLQHAMSQPDRLLVAAAPYPSLGRLVADAQLALADELVRGLDDREALWTAAGWERLRAAYQEAGPVRTVEVVATTLRVLRGWREAERAVERATGLRTLPSVTDARAQLEGLIFPGFISAVGSSQLPRLATYLKGIEVRMARVSERPGRDAPGLADMARAEAAYRAAGGVLPLPRGADADTVEFRWMLEELRIGLFAEQLKTAYPVSLKRVLSRWSRPDS